MLGITFFSGLAALTTSACDQGKQLNQPLYNTYVSVLSSNVGPQTPLPQNGVIEVHFDRFLHPGTITRQSFILVDNEGQAIAGALVKYDPVSLTVTISNPNTAISGSNPAMPWLTAGLAYKLVLPVPTSTTDPNGVRAFDGATLDPAIDHTIGFAVTNQTIPDPNLATVSFCNDVMPIIGTKCGSGTVCHNPPSGTDSKQDPAEGLILTTPSGVHGTAVGRVSQESNTAALSGRTIADGRVFGVNYPIISPGNAAESWLIYKVSLAPFPDNSQVTDGPLVCAPPAPQASAPMSVAQVSPYDPGDDERALLSDAILGRLMPYPPAPGSAPSYATGPLTFNERELIRIWIDQGAVVDSCFSCVAGQTGTAPVSDGGAQPSVDAGLDAD